MITPIHQLLRLLQNPPSAADTRLNELTKALDSILSAVHEIPAPCDQSAYVESPAPPDWISLDTIRKEFPELGYYVSAMPATPDTQAHISMSDTSDASDDLHDIANDLWRVLWLFENVGNEAAVWDFSFGFATHWGRHLLNLRSRLHFIRFEI